MWKRLQNKGTRQQSYDDPTIMDSTIYEDGYAHTNLQSGFMSPVGIQQGGISRQQPPPRPSRDKVTGLPPLPIEALQNESATKNVFKRPPSSIYSQPSPNLPSSGFPRASVAASSVYQDDVEISPPSSPDIATPVGQQIKRPINDGPVSPMMSPVDETPDISRLQLNQPWRQARPNPTGSSIPILRREKRRNQVAAAAVNLVSKKDSKHGDSIKSKKSVETLYDPLTGEFTTSDRGRRQQVKPGEFTPPSANDRGLGITAALTIAPEGQSSFGDRIRKIKESGVRNTGRPEWKGSSGRSQPVPPVADQPEIAPLRIPLKSNMRLNSPLILTSSSDTPASTLLGGQNETRVVSPTESGYPGSTTRKVDLLDADQNNNKSENIETLPISYAPYSSVAEDHQYSGLVVSNAKSSAAYATSSVPSPNTNERNLPPPRDKSTSTIERNFQEALRDVNLPAGYEQPPSRFSVTTYAPTTAPSTPRVSEDSVPPLPTPPKQPSPIVNRKRPKIGNSLDSTNQIARKAVGEPVFIGISSASRRNSKMLPKSPPESNSTDLISSLEAQLENLKRRRINLQKSIHQMTELMPTDVLARGMEARRQAEEKKKVEILREDLADVQREEHDLGLKLHRAWKRRDQNAIYEPTGLWVRRVTG